MTNDLDRWLWEHQNGVNSQSYTYIRKPVKLVFYEYFNDPGQAIAFEKQIKKWRRVKKEALIKGKWEDLPELSKNYSEK